MKLHKKAIKMLHPGIHVARHPGRWVTKPIKKRLEKRGWKHRVLDIAGIAIAVFIVLFASWYFVFNVDPGRKVEFSAVVAPKDIVSGGDSTLAISYKNNSSKTLNDVTLSLEFPPYFVLADIDHDNFEETTNTLYIDDLAPGANGLIKLRGVMFGDVNGTQTFASTLGYSWDDDKSGSRRQTYTFSPVRSALQITTELPDKLVAGQRITGKIVLKNTGKIAFPEEAIHAVFPDGFVLTETSLDQRDDQTWVVPAIEPQNQLEITYSGTLAIETGKEATFYFEPSFLFGEERFKQETLIETVTALPPPITVQVDIPNNISVNAPISASISWNAQSDLAISNVIVSIEGGTNVPTWNIDSPVTPNSKDATIIPRSGSGANRIAKFVPIVEFTLDETGDRIQVVGATVERKVTTSASVESFARYFTSAGDQLGRGPLPPRVGESTIYWVFLNLLGTVNDVDNTTVTASLPGNVSWVDKQSVTTGSGILYNASNHSITWPIGYLPATVTSGKVAAASFAVSIVPSEQEVGLVPALLNSITFRGKDLFTDVSINKSLGSINTRVPEDDGVVR